MKLIPINAHNEQISRGIVTVTVANFDERLAVSKKRAPGAVSYRVFDGDDDVTSQFAALAHSALPMQVEEEDEAPEPAAPEGEHASEEGEGGEAQREEPEDDNVEQGEPPAEMADETEHVSMVDDGPDAPDVDTEEPEGEQPTAETGEEQQPNAVKEATTSPPKVTASSIILDMMRSGEPFTRKDLLKRLIAHNPNSAAKQLQNTMGALMSTLCQKHGMRKKIETKREDDENVRYFTFSDG